MDAKALDKIGYGLYIVSSRMGDKFNGQIVNALIQTTYKPFTIAVSINRENFTHQCIETSGIFSVSILSQDTDMKFLVPLDFETEERQISFPGAITGSERPWSP